MYVSLSLTALGLDYYCDELQNDMHSKYKGRVLFDQLLSHGLKEQRFVSIYFDGEQFDMLSFRVESSVSKDIQEKCSTFFLDNPDALAKSVLSKPQQFLFKKNYYVSLAAV
ncbi:type II toxin-antitoxin system RnlB family antitoxin [Grimontia marina]|nr:type II toxin-antitoxin system RnlB family antitoxin [Grimontia marina]